MENKDIFALAPRSLWKEVDNRFRGRKGGIRLRIFKCLGGLIPFLILFLIPNRTEAYIDPASGSYVLQILLAALFASTFAVKIYWKKIKAFGVKHFSRKQVDEPENNP